MAPDTYQEVEWAGFWNYLREDITFSLITGKNLQIDLHKDAITVSPTSGQAYLNGISLVLGRIINSSFGVPITTIEYERLHGMLSEWAEAMPADFKPFSRASAGGSTVAGAESIPSVWMMQDCHGMRTPRDTLNIPG